MTSSLPPPGRRPERPPAAAPWAEVVDRLRAAGCVFAEDEASLLLEAAPDAPTLDRWVERRVAGFPLEHIVGFVDFAGLRITVTDGVFVPRRRTELLVRETLAVSTGSQPIVLDLCCGCGAVGAVVAAAHPESTVLAADLDPAAVACARRNLPTGRVFEGDLFAALPRDFRGRIDTIAANAPYVPSEAIALMPPEAREHEPWLALNGGRTGSTCIGASPPRQPGG